MCFGGGGGGGPASLSQIRQGRGMAVQRSGTSEYTDYDYSGVTAYAGAAKPKKMKALEALGGTVSKASSFGLNRDEQRAAGFQLFKGAIPQGKAASLQITDASMYNAAIDAGAYIKGQAKATTKQAELGRTAVMDETGARIKTRAARSQVANANDASVASKKTKKRGGLRIDRSSSVAGGGSGVNIPS